MKSNENEIAELLKAEAKRYNILRLGRWHNGKLPRDYTIPKQKDPINKARLIASYYDFYLKNSFKNASRVLTWLFQTVSNKCGMFTLFRLDDLKKRTKEAQRKLGNIFGLNTGLITMQSDINKMYTNLDHNQIIDAVIWVCDCARKNQNQNKRKSRKVKRLILLSKRKDTVTNKYKIMWADTEDEEYYSFTLDDILNIVHLDLQFTYQVRGKDILKQKHGCPIGGFLSCIYANIKCAKDEYDFLKSLKVKKCRIYGIRQVDDLLLLLAYDKTSPESFKEANTWKQTFLRNNGVYKGGLELEEQKELLKQEKKVCYEFAGTVVTIENNHNTRNNLLIYCKTWNKNELSLLTEGKQKLPRYVGRYSMVPDHYKLGMQIATLLRINSQTHRLDDLIEALKINRLEMISIGYDDNFLLKALQRVMGRSQVWSKVIYKLQKDQNFFTDNAKWRYICKIATRDLQNGNLKEIREENKIENEMWGESE